MEWKPKWVPLPILDFARTVHELKDDPQKCLEWVTQFADALMLGDNGSESELANELITRAQEAFARRSRSARKAGKASADARKNKSKEVAGNGNAPDESTTGLEESALTATGNDQDGGITDGSATMESGVVPPKNLAAQPDSPANDQGDRHKCGRKEPAAGGDSREGSLNFDLAENGASLESGTPATGDISNDKENAEATANGQVPREGQQKRAGGSSPPHARPPAPAFLRKKPARPPTSDGFGLAKIPVPPRNAEDVRLFALDKMLDVDDARMWYQMNYVDRPGCDKDGMVITNWKGHCTAYCKAEKERRLTG